jgi:hypothetical protein
MSGPTSVWGRTLAYVGDWSHSIVSVFKMSRFHGLNFGQSYVGVMGYKTHMGYFGFVHSSFLFKIYCRTV